MKCEAAQRGASNGERISARNVVNNKIWANRILHPPGRMVDPGIPEFGLPTRVLDCFFNYFFFTILGREQGPKKGDDLRFFSEGAQKKKVKAKKKKSGRVKKKIWSA